MSRVDDDDHATSGVQPLSDFRVDVGIGVAGRNHLDGQIGRAGEVAATFGGGAHSLARNKRRVGGADRVGIPLDQESGFSGIDRSKMILVDVLSEGQANLIVTRPCNSPEGVMFRILPEINSRRTPSRGSANNCSAVVNVSLGVMARSACVEMETGLSCGTIRRS